MSAIAGQLWAIPANLTVPARIIPMDGRPALAPTIKQWMGDSRGHWDRDTLVVETTNFNGKAGNQGSAERLQLVERFTRTSAGTLHYEYAVTDASSYAAPWTAAIDMKPVESERAPRLQIDRPTYRLTVEARREVQYYLLKVLAPLMLIVFMSWAVFWIDPQQIGAQIGLSATAILTLVAYQFALADLLPRISYLTRADRFTLSSSVLVFLALVEAVTTSALTRQGRADTGNRLDRFSRVAFPIGLAVVIVFSFLV